MIGRSLLTRSYDKSIVCKPRTNIVTADIMSCLPLQENLQVSMLGCIIHLMDHLDDATTPLIFTDVPQSILSKVYKVVQSGTNLPEEPLYSAFHIKRYELSIENGCLLWGSRLIIPHTLRQQILKELHQCHPGMVEIKALAQNYVWWKRMDVDIEEKLTVAIHGRALEPLLQGHHYIPVGSLGTRSM